MNTSPFALRASLAALSLLTGLAVSYARAQDETAPQKQPSEDKKYFDEVYESTKTAKTMADFTAIIERCDAGLAKADLAEKHQAYAQLLSAWAHNRRGEVRTDDDEAALADFSQAVELAEKDPANKWRYLHNRGVTSGKLGKYPEALADFDATIKLNPNLAKAFYNRGEIRFLRDDYDAALSDYNEALRLDPRNATTHNSRGFVYYRQANYRNAVRDYSQAIELDPKSADAYVNRGDAHGDLGSFDRALSDYRAAIRINPNNAWALRGASWIMATCATERFRNTQVALQAANKAVEIAGDDDPLFLDAQAAAFANAGDFERAKQIQTRVIELSKEQPAEEIKTYQDRLALYEKNMPYRERGNPSGARQ